MNPKRVAFQAIKYLMSEGEDIFYSFSVSDIEGLVKFTLGKMGYSPSLVTDEEVTYISGLVKEGVADLQKKRKASVPPERRHREGSIMIRKEAWYCELLKRAKGTAIDSPEKDEDYPCKEKSHLPGENELAPHPFRKNPKKLV